MKFSSPAILLAALAGCNASQVPIVEPTPAPIGLPAFLPSSYDVGNTTFWNFIEGSGDVPIYTGESFVFGIYPTEDGSKDRSELILEVQGSYPEISTATAPAFDNTSEYSFRLRTLDIDPVKVKPVVIFQAIQDGHTGPDGVPVTVWYKVNAGQGLLRFETWDSPVPSQSSEWFPVDADIHLRMRVRPSLTDGFLKGYIDDVEVFSYEGPLGYDYLPDEWRVSTGIYLPSKTNEVYLRTQLSGLVISHE